MSIADRLAQTRERVAEACIQAGRDPAEVGLVAVSKTQPAAAVHAAFAAGQRVFGENYAQELRGKAEACRDMPIEWHFIGRIQSNKAKIIAAHATRVHSLVSVRHALALSKAAAAPLPCLVSVNLGGESSKSGVSEAEALDRCAALADVPGIQVVGLMCMPPPQTDPEAAAPFFERLATLAERGRAQGLALNELSMGMSHDFHVAVRYGATWVRVGTAIFGPRA